MLNYPIPKFFSIKKSVRSKLFRTFYTRLKEILYICSIQTVKVSMHIVFGNLVIILLVSLEI